MKKFNLILLSFFAPYLTLLCLLALLFSPILISKSVIFPYALTPFDISKQYPNIWLLIKILYFICFSFCYFIVYIFIRNNIHKAKHQKFNNLEEFDNFNENTLSLKIGKTENR